MNNKDLQKLINVTIEAKLLYFGLVYELENEYVRRFGNNPSELDDEAFIDTIHYNQSNKLTVKQLTESVRDRIERKTNN